MTKADYVISVLKHMADFRDRENPDAGLYETGFDDGYKQGLCAALALMEEDE